MSWNRRFLRCEGIRKICRRKIMDDVLVPLKVEKQWKLLIVDEMALELISTCFKTEEVLSCNIAAILPLVGTRENLGYLSAIYMLCPSEESIVNLLKDFDDDGGSKYKSAHLIFLSAVPQELFETLYHELKLKWIDTLMEMDMLFLPHESQVYSLNDLSFFSSFFDAYNDINMKQYEVTAKKLVTLFTTIEKVPLIRYRRDFVKNLILAELIEKEFELQKSTPDSTLYQKEEDCHCQLLILDRGFDCISPIIHDFTFQAMAYDLLEIEDDLYLYALGHGRAEAEMQFVALTEDDPLWCKLRHEHIANVSRIVQNMIQNDELMNVAESIGSQYRGLPTLGEAMRSHLIHKRNESFYSFRHMANECMKLYCEGINVLSQLEQNLAIGKDPEDRSIKDPLSDVLAVVTSSAYTLMEKLRILLLFVFYKKGISRQEFDDLLSKAGIPFSSAGTITNLLHLDLDLFRPGSCKPFDSRLIGNERDSNTQFKQSRWVPVLKTILLDCVQDKLNEDRYPFLNADKNTKLTPAKKDMQWSLDNQAGPSLSHLVVFIAGGVSYSEMRCAYEVVRKYSKWQIYIGGDSLITPNTFLEKLKELHSFYAKDE